MKNASEVGYNINQIAKNISISVGSAFFILKELEHDEVVFSKSISNGKYYLLNLSEPRANNLCEYILIDERSKLKGAAKLYATDIQKFIDAKIIILFGSVLRNNKFNDVDVLFITDNAKLVQKFCLDLTKIRTKPVVPLIMTKKDFINSIKNKNDAVVDIIKTGVVLRGEKQYMEAMKDAIK